MGKVHVCILSFEKHNPKRTDQKRFTWFRTENRFAQSESLYGVSLEHMAIFFMLVGLAQERDTDTIEFESGWFCSVWTGGKLKEEQLLSALGALNGKVLTATGLEPDPVQTCNGDVPGTARYERTNDTNEHAPRKRPQTEWPPEVEAAYARFPRKKGKTAGMKVLMRDLLPEDYPNLLVAVSAYAANVIAEKTEKRFVQYWSTWVTGWRDWLEPDAGACATDGGERVYDFGGGDARD